MTLLELLQILKKKWYLLVIFPIVFALATAGYAWGFMTNDYTSTVSLYVLAKNQTTDSQGNTSTSTNFSLNQQIANDLAVLASTDKVKTAAAKELGLSSLGGFSVSVSGSSDNRVIKLTVSGKNPDTVPKVADTMAAQVAEAAVDIMDLKAVNVLDEAKSPASLAGPNRQMYVGVAIVVGLLAAIALIVLLDLLDTTVKTRKEIEEEFGLPVLGTMPFMKGKN
jgi:capsular polysaccharide biosynthesis protein